MNPPTSLRDLYTSPSSGWSFNAPPTNASDASTAQPVTVSYGWTTHSGSNPLLGLSGTLPDDEGIDVKALMMRFLTSALTQYASSAVAIPWEVGKTLLQVQWIPKDIDIIPVRDYAGRQDEDEEVCTEPLQLSKMFNEWSVLLLVGRGISGGRVLLC